MTTFAQLFNQYNFPPIKFINWDLSFKCPLNELEITQKNNIIGVYLKSQYETQTQTQSQTQFNNIFDTNAPSIEYQYYYPHIIYIEINPDQYFNQNLRQFAEKYYLEIIKTNQYDKDSIDNIINNFCLFK